MSYEIHTKNAYRNTKKAKEYQDQYIKGAKWARFTMWRQKGIIQKFIGHCQIAKGDSILDIPCGTGYAGRILSDIKGDIFASDISIEMMDLAVGQYKQSNFSGFVQADITQIPFPKGRFRSIIVLALMHRLPSELRAQVLSEMNRVSSKYVIISYSVESFSQRVKQWLLLKIKRTHIPAPASIPVNVMREEIASAGFTIIKKKHIMFFLSAKVVFLIEKEGS
ncbi:class I SAM-dependent methyltransferase [Oceanospirillaceae bacterium]|nr:class I SAM-dependent methyltransferase [Oceanospirillaceae bacterium]